MKLMSDYAKNMALRYVMQKISRHRHSRWRHQHGP